MKYFQYVLFLEKASDFQFELKTRKRWLLRDKERFVKRFWSRAWQGIRLLEIAVLDIAEVKSDRKVFKSEQGAWEGRSKNNWIVAINRAESSQQNPLNKPFSIDIFTDIPR